MLELAVVADDLTGAADTGVQFRSAFAPVHLMSHRCLSAEALAPPPQVLSIFTASRSLPPAEAHRSVFVACRAIGRLAPRRVYKKIDSALRGNIGAELEAAMAALNIEMSFVAPALVDQGRTTVGGLHCIHGTPVADSEMGRDPVTPVRESRLPDWIRLQARFPVAHVHLAALELGPDAASGVIRRALEQGARHFTFDAASREHLDRIAQLALNRYPQALLCGSAGLAQSLAGALGAGAAPPRTGGGPSDPSLPGRWLFACGSASERLQQQVRLLAERANVWVETLEPGWLAADTPAEGRDPVIRRAATQLAAGDTVLSLPPPSPDSQPLDPGRLAAKFAEAVVAVIAASWPAGLFLSGGDTALAVLERLGARAIRLEREVGSGLVLGRLVGGAGQGLAIVTKAGAFGPPEALIAMRKAICGDRGDSREADS
jgi:uncharacterized protein YgbK (DUF1537 family)